MELIQKNIVTLIISKIYGEINEFRNYLFRKNILKSVSFSIPIISIGNLAVGGTGKTPHVEYLIKLLSKNHKIAILSRGYGRKTKGYVAADKSSTVFDIGDEAFQIHSKFPEVDVFVCEKRVEGIEKILSEQPETELIILDDAYQHQYVKPGLSILLTKFTHLYSEDSMMPYGHLREKPKNANRANIIIVTKCPGNLSEKDAAEIISKINPSREQSVFFSKIEYGEIYALYENKALSYNELSNEDVLIISGIENPQPMIDYLQTMTKSLRSLVFSDHHLISAKEIKQIENQATGKIIITTEKDAVKLKSLDYIPENLKKNIYVLPLQIEILLDKKNTFQNIIDDYVRTN